MIKTVKNKKASLEAALVLTLAFLWNEGVYMGGRWITQSWFHYDLTNPMDELIPFLPWTVSIYFGCYIFWGINYYLSSLQKREARDRFFCADLLAKTVCFLLFILIPTTNVRPEIAGESMWDRLMAFLYWIDDADNLFPSIHCLVSWLCWISVRDRRDISPVYRWFSLAAAAAVCISTLTTRQHVLVDVAGGVLLAELCYFVAGFPKISALYSRLIDGFKQLIAK